MTVAFVGRRKPQNFIKYYLMWIKPYPISHIRCRDQEIPFKMLSTSYNTQPISRERETTASTLRNEVLHLN